MIIGAQTKDFSSIVDAAPPSFDIYYMRSDAIPEVRVSAVISKLPESFLYEFRLAEGEVVEFEFTDKVELVKRMSADNSRYNANGKCTVQF
ncbi:hypothetical protein [Cerasicoccus frondis]|uniref:hypothetical protein n=1 Tax=Cerasicoccus frondis TaxID=490090 RepID=UPI002852D3EA|nr:hypothetical protein [Cerasicoccus frondis]